MWKSEHTVHQLRAAKYRGSSPADSPLYELCSLPDKDNKQYNMFPKLRDMCSNTIAIVGNGPLSEEQRQQINSGKFTCVIRFNDLKNKKTDDRMDIHIVRYTNGAFPGIESYKHVPKLPIKPSRREPGHRELQL